MNNNSEKKSGNLYVTLVVILMSIAVVAAVAGAISRNIARVDEATSAQETKREAASTTGYGERETENVFGDDDRKKPESTATETETAAEDADVLPEFINPTGGSLMNSFSEKVPVFSQTMNDYRTHGGVDINVNLGERIMAAADGVVEEIWEDPMMGKCISVKHTGDAVSYYKNLSADLPEGIAVGKTVSAGDVIGVAGESALAEIAEEPHLHFELKIKDVFVNPAEYISFENAQESYEG